MAWTAFKTYRLITTPECKFCGKKTAFVNTGEERVVCSATAVNAAVARFKLSISIQLTVLDYSTKLLTIP